MTSVNKYRIYCNAEATWKYSWATDPITKCPLDTTHSVNPDSVSLVDSIEANEVIICEEKTKTGGHYQCISKTLTVEAGQMNSLTYSYPYPVSIICGNMNVDETQVGDCICIKLAPDTVIGAITQDILVDDGIVYVDETSIANLFNGCLATFTDGVNTSTEVVVYEVDTNAGSIKVTPAVDKAFSLSSPTYVRRTIKYANQVQIGRPGSVSIGRNLIGGSYIPANVPIQLCYKNNSNQTQVAVFHIELLY
jgi:hypothetical protein